MVRHGDWKMSTEGVQNRIENGGAHGGREEDGSLLRSGRISTGDVGEASFLGDSVPVGGSPGIQDGAGDMVRRPSFEDLIGFDAGQLPSDGDDGIVDVGSFPASIVDGSAEWLKAGGGLELAGEKSVSRELGELFSADNPLTADIPTLTLSDGLPLSCSVSSLARFSSGICHSSPVSPTNFLEEAAIPVGRSRSYSDTENDDRSQTKAFLDELERGSQLTAEDKEVMETSRKELQAYEFQVMAQDKSNSLLTPQELETLRVHGLEFEEAVESSELAPVETDVSKDCMRVSSSSFPDPEGAPAQLELSGIVNTSLSFLSVSQKATNSCSGTLAGSLLTDAGEESGDRRTTNEDQSEHSMSTTSGTVTVSGPVCSSMKAAAGKIDQTQPHSRSQSAKSDQPAVKSTAVTTVPARQKTTSSNATSQSVTVSSDGKKSVMQVGSVLPLQVHCSGASLSQPKVTGVGLNGACNIGTTLPVPGGKNVYLTAVPMLYYKDGCLVIPIQQILTSDQVPSMKSKVTTDVAVGAEAAVTAAAKPADSTTEVCTSVKGSVNLDLPQKCAPSVVTGRSVEHPKVTSNVTVPKPCQISKLDSSEAKKWVCDICSQAFPRHYKLKLHFMKHTGEKPYKCLQPGCKWAFTTAFKLKRHEESHLGKKDYVCDVDGCGKKFSTVYNLNTHKKSHSRLCTVECPTCSEKFSTQRQLDYHMRAQGHGKKDLTYICPHEGCGRKFFSRYCMGSHMRVHTQLEKIPCPVDGCKRVFDKQCRLQQHMRLHTGEKPFQCTGHGCGAAFATASKLKRHARKHTDERRWVCDIEGCGKAFLRAEHLRAHRITHTGEKPFQCNITGCSARFKCKSSLYVHLKRHTQNANRDSQEGNSVKTQRNNKHSNKTAQNQKHNYNRQLQNALGDLFTLINANDLESLINSQVDTTQQTSDTARVITNSMETLLQTGQTQSVNPSDILSVNQDGLSTILNISPVATSVQGVTRQLTQSGAAVVGDVLRQGTTLPVGVGLMKNELKPAINLTSMKVEKCAASSAGPARSEAFSTAKKLRRSLVTDSSPQTLGFSGAVKVEINHTEFPDSTTLSIQEDQVSSTVGNLVNPNEVMTSQAITFRDPETGAIYVQTQLLQDDPPNPDIYGDSNVVCLDNGDHPTLADFPNIFPEAGHDDLVEPPGVLEFTGTTINLQDLE